MAVKRKYRLNLRNYGNLPAIMLSQYDEGYALEFEIRDGTDAASDLSAYTVTLKGTRADTLAYSFSGTIATNVLTFVIDTTMTACDGRGTAEIAIKDTANDVLFATFNMPVFVERAAVPEGSIDADVERAQEIAEQVQEIVDNAAAEVKGEAESWAVGQRDGTDVPATDPTYHNNAKYYSEQAQQAADSIGIDATLTQSGKAADAKKTGDEISALKEGLSAMSTATSSDVGKALKAKTVTDGKVTEWEFGEAGASVELDATLTDPTKASPANAVGIIANLAEETSHEYATLTWENGGIKSADGSETTSDATIRTTYISMQSGDTLTYNRSSGAIGKINTTTYVYKYVNGTYKTFASLGNGSIYTADEACEIRFTVGIVSNAGITQDQAKVLATESVSVYRTVTKTFPIVQKVTELEAYLPNIDAQIESAISFLKDGTIAITPTFTKKYYYDSSLIETSYNSDYFVVAKVDISEYVGLDMQLTCYALGSAYCGFTDANDTIISTWHQSSLETRAIPFNAKYLYISHATNRVAFALNIVTTSVITDIATLKNTNGSSEYDASVNYAIGDICAYNHMLYHCITATTGAFNSDCWESSGIVEELLNRDYVHPITKLTGLSWDARGDSITAGSNGPSYVPFMADLLGIAQTDYTNSGAGGAKISGAYNGASTSKNIVTLFAGTNDFGLTSGASTLDNFEANLRTIINNFRTNNQTARLYIITPIPRFDKETNEYDLTLLDYVDKMCEVCGELNVPCLNLYDRCGINALNYTKYLRASQGDPLHPNLYGAVKIAIEIAKFVSEMEAIHRVVAFRS